MYVNPHVVCQASSKVYSVKEGTPVEPELFVVDTLFCKMNGYDDSLRTF